MKMQHLSRKHIVSKGRDHDPQLGLVRFLLFITLFILFMAVYAIFR
ncbi:hypothetical protein [Flavobacterium pallidum]|nr:hypothetical protein [Flavobacterium pallidum]